MSRILPLALLVAASASAQTVNTQVDGLVLSNGLGSVTDNSGLGTNQYVSTGVSYLTDGDTSTFAFNLGNSGSGSLQGNFSGATSSSATGVYIISLATSFAGAPVSTMNGPSFTVELALSGGLSASQTYGDVDFTITSQKINPLSFYSGPAGVVMTGIDPEAQWSAAHYYAYLYIPFSDFSATYDQVVGIKLSNFSAMHPDISYISTGYAGTYSGGPPVPEPSTYGLMLGGLALAGAAIRRRKISK